MSLLQQLCVEVAERAAQGETVRALAMAYDVPPWLIRRWIVKGRRGTDRQRRIVFVPLGVASAEWLRMLESCHADQQRANAREADTR